MAAIGIAIDDEHLMWIIMKQYAKVEERKKAIEQYADADDATTTWVQVGTRDMVRRRLENYCENLEEALFDTGHWEMKEFTEVKEVTEVMNYLKDRGNNEE